MFINDTEISELRRLAEKAASGQGLASLEDLVTRYENFLNRISTLEFDCGYYLERLASVEESLRDARYGHSEAQRERGYRKAADSLLDNLDEFAQKYSTPVNVKPMIPPTAFL